LRNHFAAAPFAQSRVPMDPTFGLPNIPATFPSFRVTSMGHLAEHISHWLYLTVSIQKAP
jgi:hypothetical protein